MKVVHRGIDAALVDDLQTIDRLAERQQLRLLDHLPGTRGNAMGHLVERPATGAQLRLDDILLHQPAHDRPRPGFMSGETGDFWHYDGLLFAHDAPSN
ncbi:hypothetical protein D3C86_1931350 [compost metagenome]